MHWTKQAFLQSSQTGTSPCLSAGLERDSKLTRENLVLWAASEKSECLINRSTLSLSKGEAENIIFACPLCAEQGIGTMVSASSRHYLCSSLGSCIVLEQQTFKNAKTEARPLCISIGKCGVLDV